VKLVLLGCAASCAVALLFVAGGGGHDRAQEPATGTAALVAPHISAPKRPAHYRMPRHAVRVSTARAFRSALAAHNRKAIVLAPGSYGGRQPYFNPYGHRIYSARLGKAVLRAGLSLGGNVGPGGGLVRGVVVDVGDASRTVDGAAIAVWGTGRRSRILDTTLRGHGVVPSGVSARRPDGLVVRRVVVRGFTDYGVLADANDVDRGTLSDPLTVADVDVAAVARRAPGSSNGRAEACVWIGNTGSVRRVRARNCGWSGVWTGTATHGATFDQITVDRAPTGIYIEHFTHDSTFRHLRVGPHVKIGLTAEWADPSWGSRPASVDNVVEDSRFDSTVAGVYLDEGTTRTTIRRSTFVNQSWGAIGDYQGNGNQAYANDYRGVAGVRRDRLADIPREG
jgi:hypothetical protein